MRIIAGSSGGIPIKVPKDITRPTTDRVREAIFSSLGEIVIEAKVLDLFAGSGSLGIECLSRGAQSACFVDQSRGACQVIKENLSKTNLHDKATVRNSPVARFLKGLGPQSSFDLVFADPPYARDSDSIEALTNFLSQEKLSQIIAPDGYLILESNARQSLPEMENLYLHKEKEYGDTRVTFFRPTTD